MLTALISGTTPINQIVQPGTLFQYVSKTNALSIDESHPVIFTEASQNELEMQNLGFVHPSWSAEWEEKGCNEITGFAIADPEFKDWKTAYGKMNVKVFAMVDYYPLAPDSGPQKLIFPAGAVEEPAANPPKDCKR